MGKIIAVWSDCKKSGKSVTVYLLANQMRKMAAEGVRILVCCLNLKYSPLYKLFGISLSAVGLEDLINCQMLKSGSDEMFSDMAMDSGGIFFVGSYRTTNSYINKNIHSFENLLDGMKENFDLIIFDTVSGYENQLTNAVLKKADVILRLLVQDSESLGELARQDKYCSAPEQEILHMISMHRNIYPRLRDIRRRYALKNVYKMDYCETLQEMKNRGSLHLYMQRDTACGKTISELSKYLLETLSIISQISSSKEKNRNYFRSLIQKFGKTILKEGESANETKVVSWGADG